MPSDQDLPTEHPQRNAFTVMLTSATELKLPPKILTTNERYEVRRDDRHLHYDIIDLFNHKGFGFSPATGNSTGKQIVKALTDAIFHIQPRLRTFNGRIPNLIPSYFSALLDHVYNNPQAHKHALHLIKKGTLHKISSPLFSLMLFPVMQAAAWKQLFTFYQKNINRTNHQNATGNHSLTLQSIGDGTSSHIKFVVGASVRKPNLIV